MARTFQVRQTRSARELACAIRGVDCRVTVSYVCHHCGLPLCDGPNCYVADRDRAFSGTPLAIHCPECQHAEVSLEQPLDRMQEFRTVVVRFLRRQR